MCLTLLQYLLYCGGLEPKALSPRCAYKGPGERKETYIRDAFKCYTKFHNTNLMQFVKGLMFARHQHESAIDVHMFPPF